MYNVCLRMVRNEADAEDLLQNSFIDVFSKLKSFRYESSIGAWIKKIVVNNCINFLKKRRLHFEELNEKFNTLPGDESGNGSEESQRMTVDAVNRAMMKLPDGYRVVFSLYAMEGYDHEEISQILGITESTSKSQYSRARQRLQDLLRGTVGMN
jgi:RNA polymerase sigma-70 factor (ECF subfamily)